MNAATSGSGSAARWGPLWGARPRDWSRSEEQQVPTYAEAIRRAGIAPGRRVLDVGCGSGVFLREAAERGADVFGLDASEPLLELARERVPAADLRLGDIQFLPYESDSFDVVTGFNSFFFAADIVAAVGEARRVARPGGPVVIQVWGRPDACDLTVVKQTVAQFMPTPKPGRPPAPELWRPGVLEQLATAAGLTPDGAYDVSWAYEYPDADAMSRAMVAAGGISVAVGPEREDALRAALVEALAPFRGAEGAYRLANEWHGLVARA
jgi:SAM-dependent methyltransferase